MEIKADDILRAEIIFKQIQLIGLEQAEAIKKLQQLNQNLVAENQKLKEEIKRLTTLVGDGRNAITVISTPVDMKEHNL